MGFSCPAQEYLCSNYKGETADGEVGRQDSSKNNNLLPCPPTPTKKTQIPFRALLPLLSGLVFKMRHAAVNFWMLAEVAGCPIF